MLVAIVTRFYDYFSLPLMHDEFSALFRARFDNFSDLIEHGVKVDGHPPLVQLYYYFMVNNVGESPWVLKLPFTVMGVASVYLLYRITKEEFSETAALISSSILCVSELGIMYSHLARPYASGLFFVLVFYWQLLKISKDNRDKYYINSSLFVISGTLAAYNHHFSLLAIAIIGIMGVFTIQKSHRFKHILLCAIIAFTYLPNLPVFFAQLKLGGIGQWLSPPDIYFLPDFVGFILNYNVLFYLTIGILMFLSIIVFRERDKSFKTALKHLTIFFSALVIGIIYSIKINPVLQFSVLIFFVPFLIIPITALIRELPFKFNMIIVFGILSIGTFSLISTRGYYQYNYTSPYLSILSDCRDAQIDETTPALIHSHYRITNYYLSSDTRPIHFRWSTSFKNEDEFDQYLQTCVQNSNQFYFGAMSDVKPEFFTRIIHYYPHIQWQRNYFGATTYLFTKGKPKLNMVATKDFDSISKGKWNNYKGENSIEQQSNVRYQLKNQEWCLGTESLLSPLLKHNNQFLDAKVDVYLEHYSAEVVLVLVIIDGNENVQYKASSTKTFLNKDRRFPVHLTAAIKLSDIKLSEQMKVKTYIWNPSKSNSIIDNYSLSLREGNPIIYGMFNPIP